MPHRNEQKSSVKNVTQNGGIDRLGWGRRLDLLSLIGILGFLWFGTVPAQAAPFAYAPFLQSNLALERRAVARPLNLGR